MGGKWAELAADRVSQRQAAKACGWRLRRSSLKGRGRSRVLAGPSSCPRSVVWARRSRRRGQGSGGARPRSGRQGLEAVAVRCMLFRWSRVCAVPSPRLFDGVWWTWLASVPVLAVGSRPGLAARSSLRRVRQPRWSSSRKSLGRGRHDGVRQSGRSGSIRKRDLAVDVGHDLHDLATDREPWGATVSRRLPGWVL